jgi:type III pantothenate kinase
MGLLAIDIGNTNIYLGFCQNGKWIISWRARTVADKMPDEYAVLLRNFLGSVSLTHEAINGVVLSSVVPPLTLAFVELSHRYLNIEPLVVTHTTHTGIRIEIDQPEQAGADRIVNSAAVVALYGAPAIVIDFGTATTFDVVDYRGAYKGGIIAPGINLSLDALVAAAAKLPRIAIAPPENRSVIGRTTADAMLIGVFWGYVAMMEGLVARMRAEIGRPTKVISTGGLAVLFNDNSDIFDAIAPDLTIQGLALLYERSLQTE